MRLFSRSLLGAVGLGLALCGPPPAISAQTKDCEPVADRGSRTLGCYITAREELGPLAKSPPLYWHIDRFGTRDSAVAARGPRGTVVESLGQIWLFTLADSSWRPASGRRVARIGPLALVPADSFAAVYMEGVFQPGMQSAVHRHPGVEAWYTIEGEQCVETPKGKLTQRAGEAGLMVEGGLPMRLTATGSGIRRSLVLILQDATQPRSTHAQDWIPRGLCHP